MKYYDLLSNMHRVVAGMRIDSSKVGDSHIFHPWGWSVALIVSERLKQAMEEEGITERSSSRPRSSYRDKAHGWRERGTGLRSATGR